ncbi:MAG: alginate lyase [Brevundimonas sp.]|nr:MAG: alginate lyase [Brevundimonas sp.]
MIRFLPLPLLAAVLLTGAPAAAQTAATCRGSDGYATADGGLRTFLWNPDRLALSKSRLASDPDTQVAYRALIERADAALGHGPYTVVDKSQTPASGDKHDYMSMGPYWWPDPETPGGLPYVRRDGRMNPERETNAFDLSDLEAMSQDVQALALAYYFTDDARYATKAAELIRAWFLTPETRMNPNFNHGQAVPGRVSGRAEGVIDAARLIRVVEGTGLIGSSDALSAEEHMALQEWFAELVRWMATSPIGREERAAANNHGVYYDALISEFALYAGMDDVARVTAEGAKARRLNPQIAPDGSLPLELQRTRSFHYTTWTLTAAFDLADLGRCVGVDLWSYQGPNGQSLRNATDYIAAYAGREQEWPHPELDKSETIGLYEVLLRAGWAWDAAPYADKARAYAPRNPGSDLLLRIPVREP